MAYPGLPVGQVVVSTASPVLVRKDPADAAGGLEPGRFVLVIQPIAEQLPQHAPAASAASEPAHGKKKGGHK